MGVSRQFLKKMINKVKLTGKLRKNTTAIHVCKTSIFYFQGRNIYCQGSYFHAAFTVYSFIKTNVGRNATQYVAVKVTRPSFLRGIPSYFEALWYPHLYFYCKSNT